jgi:hypothetical protein
MAALLIAIGSMCVITAFVVTLIRARSQDHPGRFIFIVLLLMCILVGLAACVPEPGPDIPSGPPSYNIPTPTISGPNPLQPGTPCPWRVIGENCGQ